MTSSYYANPYYGGGYAAAPYTYQCGGYANCAPPPGYTYPGTYPGTYPNAYPGDPDPNGY
ncbi:hypothetical protein AA0323_1131 [Asaia siamensis NRIC 0323]|nr:hypothetical protein AA0323_1131 [Asaia siamensis NRIC 0323]